MTDSDSKTRNFLTAATSAGISEGGAAWAAKALYPPAALPNVGIPDDTQSSTLLPEYRVDYTLTNYAHPGAVWDAAIILHSGDFCFATVNVGPSGTDFRNPASWTDVTMRHIYVPGDSGASQEVNTLSPDLSPGAPTPVLTSSQAPRGVRITHSSLTGYMSASALENGGGVTAGQVRPDMYSMGMAMVDHPDASGVSHNRLSNLPLSEQAISLNCPRFYAGAAKDGFYVPKRLAPDRGFSAPYVNENDLVSVRPDSLGAGAFYLRGKQCLSERTYYGAQLGGDLIPYVGAAAVIQTASTPDSVGIIIIRGLHPNASYKLKGYLGLQLIPQMTSSDLGFLRPPAGYDERAVGFYEAYSRTMPDAYCAADNFLGAIFNAAKAFIPKLFSFLAPAARSAVSAAAPVLAATAVKAVQPKVKAVVTRPARAPSRTRSSSARSTGSVRRVRVKAPRRR